MVSIIITSFKEPKTIGRAIISFIEQDYPLKEIIVVAPDDLTLRVAESLSKRYPKIKTLKDPGKGKPTALNLAIPKAKSKIIVLSDGDVYVRKTAVRELVSMFKESVGAVSGRVIAANDSKTMYGFWAHISTELLHSSRKRKIDLCTGYLYAIKKDLYTPIPANTLADDAYISLMIKNNGNEIVYSQKAEVYVLYPDNLIDWIKQKKRTAGKFYQLSRKFKVRKEREFLAEMKSGLFSFSKITSPKQLAYLFFLFVMRSYIWARIFFDYRLWGRQFEKAWLRPVSTKKSL